MSISRYELCTMHYDELQGISVPGRITARVMDKDIDRCLHYIFCKLLRSVIFHQYPELYYTDRTDDSVTYLGTASSILSLFTFGKFGRDDHYYQDKFEKWKQVTLIPQNVHVDTIQSTEMGEHAVAIGFFDLLKNPNCIQQDYMHSVCGFKFETYEDHYGDMYLMIDDNEFRMASTSDEIINSYIKDFKEVHSDTVEC